MARVLRMAELRQEQILTEDGQLTFRQRRAYKAIWLLWNLIWIAAVLCVVGVLWWVGAYFHNTFQQSHAYAKDPFILQDNGHIRVEFDPCLLQHADDLLEFALNSGTYGSDALTPHYFYATRAKDIQAYQARGAIYLGKVGGNRLDIDVRQITRGKEKAISDIFLRAECPYYGVGMYHVYCFKPKTKHPYRFF